LASILLLGALCCLYAYRGTTLSGSKDKDVLLKAYESARAWSSLIVTLSSAGIVFTAIFRRDFASPSESLEQTEFLFSAWIALGIAAALGVFFLGALTATLNKGSFADLDVFSTVKWWLGFAQLVAFMIGVTLVITFAYLNLS
jgi:hypothetical protein